MAALLGKTEAASQKNHSGTRRFSLNIGTILFGAVFLYILVCLILYLTSGHVRSYQVTAGPLAKNSLYTGLAVRSERVIRADASGYLNYFAQENSKIKKNGAVYAVSPTEKSKEGKQITMQNTPAFLSDVKNFSSNYTPNQFHDVYTLKYRLSSALYENMLLETPELSEESALAGTVTIGDLTISCAPAEGIISYAVDGYEDFNIDDFTAEDLNAKNYQKTDLKRRGTVTAGEEVYKIIDDNHWSLLIPLTAKQVVQLSGRDRIRVKFLQDGVSQSAALSILTMEDDVYYGKLDFTSGLERYLGERFLDIELVTNNYTGLKIPVTSIVNKSFLTVPDSYATMGGDGSEIGFLRSFVQEDGSRSVVFTTTTLYEHLDGFYYIDDEDFHAGDVLLKENDATSPYTLGEMAQLEGVYSLNKGYAVFRKVVIIDKNEEYCIVESGTDYGISQYDYIVLDASGVEESEITAA